MPIDREVAVEHLGDGVSQVVDLLVRQLAWGDNRKLVPAEADREVVAPDDSSQALSDDVEILSPVE